MRRDLNEEWLLNTFRVFMLFLVPGIVFYFLGHSGLVHVVLGMAFALLLHRLYLSLAKALGKKVSHMVGDVMKITSATSIGIVIELLQIQGLLIGGFSIEDIIACVFGGLVCIIIDRHYMNMGNSLRDLDGTGTLPSLDRVRKDGRRMRIIVQEPCL